MSPPRTSRLASRTPRWHGANRDGWPSVPASCWSPAKSIGSGQGAWVPGPPGRDVERSLLLPSEPRAGHAGGLPKETLRWPESAQRLDGGGRYQPCVVPTGLGAVTAGWHSGHTCRAMNESRCSEGKVVADAQPRFHDI